MLNWQCKNFEDLSVHELYQITKVRQAVFVIEQNCIYPDLDDIDQQCLHLFATSSTDHLKVIAYLRIVPPALKYPQASIGRVLTTSQSRGTGAGISLITKAIEKVRQEYPHSDIKISAQLYLQNFYQRFGFKKVSDVYDEDGIEHISMLLNYD